MNESLIRSKYAENKPFMNNVENSQTYFKKLVV